MGTMLIEFGVVSILQLCDLRLESGILLSQLRELLFQLRVLLAVRRDYIACAVFQQEGQVLDLSRNKCGALFCVARNSFVVLHYIYRGVSCFPCCGSRVVVRSRTSTHRSRKKPGL